MWWCWLNWSVSHCHVWICINIALHAYFTQYVWVDHGYMYYTWLIFFLFSIFEWIMVICTTQGWFFFYSVSLSGSWLYVLHRVDFFSSTPYLWMDHGYMYYTGLIFFLLLRIFEWIMVICTTQGWFFFYSVSLSGSWLYVLHRVDFFFFYSVSLSGSWLYVLHRVDFFSTQHLWVDHGYMYNMGLIVMLLRQLCLNNKLFTIVIECEHCVSIYQFLTYLFMDNCISWIHLKASVTQFILMNVEKYLWNSSMNTGKRKWINF